MQKYYFIFVLIFLSACNSLPPTPSNVSETIVITPSATPTIVPSLTPTVIHPTFPPIPTTDPNSFRDDFNENLDPQWIWVREDPRNWSLTNVPGSLQINVSRGYIPAHTNTNLLLRPAPVGNFQIETQITFKPMDNFQFAGLIIYESDSNFIQAGREYCNAVGCVGEGLYMDYYRKGVVVKPNFGPTHNEIDPILLRLSRREDTYTFEISADGKTWFFIGSHISDMNPLQIGLTTGQRLRGNNLSANFEYFEVRSLP